MTEPAVQFRYRITYRKDGPLRFIGHLDFAKTWERVLRRAGTPLVYSQGFNPQPRMQIAAALPVGVTGHAELLDIWLHKDIDVERFLEQVNAASPPGLTSYRVESVPPKAPALQTRTVGADYRVEIDEIDGDELRRRVSDLLAQENIFRERRSKPYDLRPLIFDLAVEGENTIRARLALGDAGTARPDELLAALGLAPNRARSHRLELHLSGETLKPESPA